MEINNLLNGKLLNQPNSQSSKFYTFATISVIYSNKKQNHCN